MTRTTNDVVKFLDGQKGFEHFALKPVRAYSRKPGKIGFDPESYDYLTFPFMQAIGTIQRQMHLDNFVNNIFVNNQHLMQEGDLQ